MAIYLSEFRKLYQEIHDLQSRQVAPLLVDWARQHAAILEPLDKFRRFDAPDNAYRVESDDLESLYALSRVCDLLLLPFQAGEVWFDLSRNQFAEFWQKLDITAREPRDYHPFWCEIAECEKAEDNGAPPRIEELLWPALTWGDLLICRAGARVKAGRDWMNAEVAASSLLYFASRRNARTAHDLSHGWGGNSQWNTNFRRDYVWGAHYIFNADGAPNWENASLSVPGAAR